jgi:cell division septum initiation protein DivIVA
MSTTTTIASRTATLGDEAQVISGVAIAPGDITRGLSGDRKVWEADALQAAAETLIGTDINPLHSEQSVGEVTDARFDPDRGVVYEATLTDAKLADQVRSGALKVSIEARHADGGQTETERGAAMRATDITFTGLALVQRPASPSATAQPGQAATLAEGVEAILAEMVSEGDRVQWDWGGGTARGRVTDVYDGDGEITRTIDGEAITRDSDERPVAAVEVWRGEEYDGLALKYADNLDQWDAPEAAQAMASPSMRVPNTGAADAARKALRWKDEHADEVDAGAEDGEGWRRAQQLVDHHENDEPLDADYWREIRNFHARHHNQGNETLNSQYQSTPWRDNGYVSHLTWGGDAGYEQAQRVVQAMDSEAEANAYHGDEDADLQDVPDAYVFDNPGAAVAAAEDLGFTDGAGDERIHTHGEGDDVVFMPAPTHQALLDALRERDELASVGPIEYDSVGDGDLDESAIPTDDFARHYLHAGDTKSDSSYPLVDADGVLRRGNLDAAWDLRGQGDLGMPRDEAERILKALGREFGDPDEEANPIPQDAYADADDSDDSESEAAAPDPTDDAASAEALDADGTDSDTTDPDTTTTPTPTDMTDDDTPDDDIQALKARLSDKTDRVEDLEQRIDDLEAENERLSAKAEAVDEATAAHAEALAAHVPRDAEALAEDMDLATMRTWLADIDEASLADGTPDPDTDPAVQSGGGGGEETAGLSADTREEIAALQLKIDRLPNTRHLSGRKQELREEAAALGNVDSYDDLDDYTAEA